MTDRRTRTSFDDSGASAVEYGLLVAGIAAVIVAVVFLFGGFISNVFSGTCDAIADGGNPGSVVAEANCDAPVPGTPASPAA